MTQKTITIVTPNTLDRAAASKAKNGGGTVVQRSGRMHVRLSLGALGRRMFVLPEGTTEAAAEKRRSIMAEMAGGLLAKGQIGAGLPLLERAAEATDERTLHAIVTLAKKVARGEAVMKPGSATTIRDLASRWTSGELARLYPAHVKKKANGEADAKCFERYVFPVAGDLPVESFSLDHADQIMARIPAKRAQNTRRNIAVRLHRLFALAVYPLRLLAANPLPKGFLPKPGEQKAKVCLYPKEDHALLACTEIPLARRVLYGFLAREGMRSGEALALRWTDLDLDHGAITLDTNKTSDPRSWALDPGVTAALVAWRSICESKGHASPHVFEGLSHSRAADMLRDDLRAAGVMRAELFETNENRLPVRVHDLRSTFVTLSLANGRTEGWIMDRTGHRSSQMIARYRRGARKASELHLGPLAPLRVAIPELAGSGSGDSAATDDKGAERAPDRGAAGAEDDPGESEAPDLELSQPLAQPVGSAEPTEVADGCEASTEIQIPAESRPLATAETHGLRCKTVPRGFESRPHLQALTPRKRNGKQPATRSEKETESVRAEPTLSQPESSIAPTNPRASLVTHLSAGMAAALASGDLEAARVAYEAIGKLLGQDASPGGAVAHVVDLGAERERRTGR